MTGHSLRLAGSAILNLFPKLTALFRIPVAPGAGGRLPREPDYWRLWIVGVIIFIVRWIEILAIAIFVYQRTSSAFIVAFLMMLRMAPMGLFGAFLGDFADRIERRTGLILMVGIMLATSIILALLAHFDRLEVWHLGVASFIHGIVWAADNPIRRMMIGEVVGSDRMATAMSIDIGTNNASRVAGPTIGGLLLATIGIYGAFAIGAAMYVVALAVAFMIRARNAPMHHASGGMLARIAEGVRLAQTNERLRGTLIITLVFNLFGWPFSSMIPVLGQDNLHLGPAGIGILASTEGIGAFCGAIVIALFVGPAHYARIYIGGVFIYQASLTLFALSPHSVPAGIALMLTGVGGACFAIMQTTLIYQTVAPAMRGRMLGVLTVCIGINPIGFVHVGLLAELIGAQWATVTTGVEGLICMLLTRRYWKALGA